MERRPPSSGVDVPVLLHPPAQEGEARSGGEQGTEGYFGRRVGLGEVGQ